MAVSHVHSTLNRWVVADALELVCDFKRSQGAYLFDALTGKEYLDFFGFFGARPLAFNHPKFREPAFMAHIGRTALHKPSNCDIFSVEYADFVQAFTAISLGGAFAHVFFIEGGAPAVENAVKAAMDWKHRKNIAAHRGEKGSQILHFKQAFHGRTGYCLSLTDSYDIRKTLYFPKFPWPRVLNPKIKFPLDAANLADVQEREAQSLAQIEAAFDANPDDIAAIVIEPVQCEGGDNYFRAEFLATLRALCHRREALLIFDEVQTGFGTTGKWWDWQHHNVQPDLLVFGKKTQVCGVAATHRLDEVDSVFQIKSRISSTFSGALVDMVRCTRIIEIIEEDHLLHNAGDMGAYLVRVLQELAHSHPQMSAVRGRGLLVAFDLPTTAYRDKVLRACFEEQLLVLPCGEKTIRMRPALDITADAVGRAGAQLEVAMRRVARA